MRTTIDDGANTVKNLPQRRAEPERQGVPFNPATALMFTVDEFCKAHRISHTTYYELQGAGRGPDLIRIGRKSLISREAAEEWRQRMRALASGS